MSNTLLWDKLKVVPPSAQKKITGGRLKGLTDIKPQWRYEIMTKELGPCGIGWKFTVDRLWTEPGSYEQVMCFASVSLFIHVNHEKWSDAIPGVGGSMLVAKETGGLYTSDEGYKMAITDALSTAMKMIGVGSDVYMGMASSKYSPKPPVTPQRSDDVPLFDSPPLEEQLAPKSLVNDFQEACEKNNTLAELEIWHKKAWPYVEKNFSKENKNKANLAYVQWKDVLMSKENK